MAEWFMPFVTKRQPLNLSGADRKRLEDLRRSRSAEKRQVLHAAILLACANGMSDNAVAVANGVNRHTVSLCVRKFLQFGIDAALGELPRPGKSRRISDDAIAWVLHCACQKPKDLGYSYELRTYSLLQAHVRKHCLAASHPSLLALSRSKTASDTHAGRDPAAQDPLCKAMSRLAKVPSTRVEMLSFDI